MPTYESSSEVDAKEDEKLNSQLRITCFVKNLINGFPVRFPRPSGKQIGTTGVVRGFGVVFFFSESTAHMVVWLKL